MAAAATDGTSASTNNCETTRARLAPSAVRTAISPMRVAVRAYTRMATFTATMSSMRPTPNWKPRIASSISGPLMPMKACVYGSDARAAACRESAARR